MSEAVVSLRRPFSILQGYAAIGLAGSALYMRFLGALKTAAL